MEDHIQEAQQQIMESVKTQEHELCQQRWVIECAFFFYINVFIYHRYS